MPMVLGWIRPKHWGLKAPYPRPKRTRVGIALVLFGSLEKKALANGLGQIILCLILLGLEYQSHLIREGVAC